MKIIGLTGSIGMGKSTVAEMLREMGLPIWGADDAVHEVFKKGGAAVGPVGEAFPGTVKRGAVDRELLGRAVSAEPKMLRRLEKIVHPLIQKSRREFLKDAKAAGKKAAVLEIPLLFETGGERQCDAVLCVSAPAAMQRKRVLARKKMTEEKFEALLARQMPDAEKCKRADFVVPTGGSLAATKKAVREILRELDLKI